MDRPSTVKPMKSILALGAQARRSTPAGMLALLVLLAGCASSPPSHITLPSTAPQPAKTADQVSGLEIEKIEWEGTKPGCEGRCPSIKIDSVGFPEIPKLTALVNHALAYMTGVDPGQPRPYQTISEYTQYFWQTAQALDTTI